MAESPETSKVECRSKRAVASILEAINENIEQIVNGNCNSSEDDKQKCRQRFREIYESALQQNLLIDGEEWAHSDLQNETSEFEPVDVEKKNFLNNELTPNLDNAILRVARKRKFHPRFCEEEVYEGINKNAFYLAKVEVQNDDKEAFSPKEGQSLMTEEDLNTQLGESLSALGSLTKSVTSSLENAVKLQTAVSILKHPTETDKVIFENNGRNGFKNTAHQNGRVNPFDVSTIGPKESRHQDFVMEF